MNEWTTAKWEETIKSIFSRALVDAEFRGRCKSDPDGVIRETSGRSPPVPGKIAFVEELDTKTLVLPKVWKGQFELSEIDVSRIVDAAFRCQSLLPRSLKDEASPC